MSLPARTDTAVIGAGHAGLIMSRLLSQAGHDHVVIDRRTSLGGGWQDRWDAFRLVTPNWVASLPGQPYDGSEPDGFMARDEIVSRVAAYADAVDAPVALGIEVTRLATRNGGGFEIDTTDGALQAERVVVATGGYHVPRVPALASSLPDDIVQLHSHDYRNPASLPDGGVLVVGSGQSGVQIAEELTGAGREVILAVGGAGRIPRRYRGRDIFRWMADIAMTGPELGLGLPTVDMLPDPRARKAANPHLSGHRGGHTTNLRQMAADGMRLVGHIDGVNGHTLQIAPDLARNLAFADGFFGERFQPLIERFIATAGIDAPPDDEPSSRFEPPQVDELDLRAAGISTIVWATGYDLNFSWIDLPIFDELGFPRHQRGMSEVPGLGFLGLPWQHTMASATLIGPTLDGPALAAAMGIGSTAASAPTRS